MEEHYSRVFSSDNGDRWTITVDSDYGLYKVMLYEGVVAQIEIEVIRTHNGSACNKAVVRGHPSDDVLRQAAVAINKVKGPCDPKVERSIIAALGDSLYEKLFVR
jgi:hypothetical protein